MREDRNFSFSSTMNPIHYGGNPEVIYPQYRTSCWNRSPMKPFLLGLLFCTPSEGPGVKCHPGIHTGLWLVYTLWLTPALSILHYQTLTELLPALNILIFFRAAAQMQASWLIRNFDQYEFLHPPQHFVIRVFLSLFQETSSKSFSLSSIYPKQYNH